MSMEDFFSVLNKEVPKKTGASYLLFIFKRFSYLEISNFRKVSIGTIKKDIKDTRDVMKAHGYHEEDILLFFGLGKEKKNES